MSGGVLVSTEARSNTLYLSSFGKVRLLIRHPGYYHFIKQKRSKQLDQTVGLVIKARSNCICRLERYLPFRWSSFCFARQDQLRYFSGLGRTTLGKRITSISDEWARPSSMQQRRGSVPRQGQHRGTSFSIHSAEVLSPLPLSGTSGDPVIPKYCMKPPSFAFHTRCTFPIRSFSLWQNLAFRMIELKYRYRYLLESKVSR